MKYKKKNNLSFIFYLEDRDDLYISTLNTEELSMFSVAMLL